MDTVHFLQEEGDGRLVLCQPGYKDTTTARKHIGGLDLGVYHLVSLVETGITVGPPEAPTKNAVKRGTVLRTRAPSEKAKAKKGDGKAAK